MQRIFITLLAAALLAFVAAPAAAQRLDGDLRGEVKDPGGAIIPGAKVTVINQQTGTKRSIETTDAGVFFAGNLLPGKYTVEVELQGFKKAIRRNVDVAANRVTDIILNMELGEVTQTVEVTATTGIEQVQTSTASLGTTFTNEQLTSAAASAGQLDGNPINLALLAPGTTTQSGGVVGTGGAIGGNRPRQNNFVVDGLDNNDPSVTGPLTPVIADAVEEFTLLTNQFTAEYGNGTAGQFLTTTKTGSNDLHGRAWLYVQNRHLNSLDNLTRAVTPPGDPKPKFDWQRYGGQAGGKFIEDRWFWFGSYERQELDLAATPGGTIFVPTAAGRSALMSLAGDPASGVSPVNAGIILDNVPTASMGTRTTNVFHEGTGTTVPIELGPFSSSAPNFLREHRFVISQDFNTEAHRISGRFFFSRQRSVGAGELPVAQFNHDIVNDSRRFTIGDTWTINSRMLNELRFAYLRQNDGFVLSSLPAAPGTTDIFANYQMPDINLFIGPQSNFPQGSFNNIYQLTNNFTWTTGGSHTWKFGGEYRNIIAPSDFLPRARGEYEWVALSGLGQVSDMDAFLRDFFPSSVSIRGVGLSRFSQNRSGFSFFVQDTWKIHPRFTLELGVRYEFTQIARDSALQDLNALANIDSIRNETYSENGLRAFGLCDDDPMTPLANCVGNPLIGTNIFSSLSTDHQNALLFHVGENLIFQKPNPDLNNFAPRIGLAWDVFGTGKTSLRAGFAVAHDNIFGNLALLQLPPQAQAEARETNACTVSPAPAWCAAVSPAGPAASPGISFSGTGFIEGGAIFNILPTAAATDRSLARSLTGAWIPENEISPETYTWSLSLQQEVRGAVVEGRYVGTRAVHLPVQRWVNAGIPNDFRIPTFANMGEIPSNFTGQPTLADFFANRNLMLAPYGFEGVMTKFSPDGTSDYHGVSISARGNLTRALNINTSYTFSKTIDDIENELFTSFMNPRRPWNHIDIHEARGLSGLHHAHKFVLSGVWTIPGANFDNGFARRMTSGWILMGAYVAETGQPLTILSRRDTNGDFDTAGDRGFANPANSNNLGSDVTTVCFSGGVVSTGCTASSMIVGYVATDPSARYVRPGTGSFAAGSLEQLGRNTFESPGINNVNLSIAKDTSLTEGTSLRFQADFINAFNHPSFSIGAGSVFPITGNATGFPNYVTPGTAQFLDKTIFSGGLGQNPFQRVIQLSLKFLF